MFKHPDHNAYFGVNTDKSQRVRFAHRETGLSPPVKYFTDRSKAAFLLWIV